MEAVFQALAFFSCGLCCAGVEGLVALRPCVVCNQKKIIAWSGLQYLIQSAFWDINSSAEMEIRGRAQTNSRNCRNNRCWHAMRCAQEKSCHGILQLDLRYDTVSP